MDEVHNILPDGRLQAGASIRRSAAAAYDPEEHSHLVHIFNMDLKCDTLVWAGYATLGFGLSGSGEAGGPEAIESGAAPGPSLQLVLVFRGRICAGARGETHLARQWIAEAHAIAREHAMGYHG